MSADTTLYLMQNAPMPGTYGTTVQHHRGFIWLAVQADNAVVAVPMSAERVRRLAIQLLQAAEDAAYE